MDDLSYIYAYNIFICKQHSHIAFVLCFPWGESEEKSSLPTIFVGLLQGLRGWDNKVAKMVVVIVVIDGGRWCDPEVKETPHPYLYISSSIRPIISDFGPPLLHIYLTL